MNDAQLVTTSILRSVLGDLQSPRTSGLDAIGSREPVLAAYLATQLLLISGKLALSGAPTAVVQACNADIEELLQVALAAVWRSHDELWAGVTLRALVRAGRPKSGRNHRVDTGALAGNAEQPLKAREINDEQPD